MPDEVDISAYDGREQAIVKHSLLEQYLPPLGYKVQHGWDSLVLVDGFAGPWETKMSNFEDSSFAIATKTLRAVQKTIRRRFPVRLFFADSIKRNFQRLEQFAADNSGKDFRITALHGEFANLVPKIVRAISTDAELRNPFRFVFLDPKGWSQIPMGKLRPLLKERSCEVLINLMTRFITRFVNEDDHAGSLTGLFGREDVLPLFAHAEVDREDLAVREYSRSLKLVCGFRYAASAAILEPQEEAVRYYLVYGTHHPKGIQVFKGAEMRAVKVQDSVRSQVYSRDQGPDLFAGLVSKSTIVLEKTRRNRIAAKRTVVELLRSKARIEYDDLYCEAMAHPFVEPKDLRKWIEDLHPNVEYVLKGDNRRAPALDRGDVVAVVNRAALERANKR
jgi:three-Cys-motif partner protein